MDDTFRPRSNFVWAGVSLALIILFAANSFFVVTNATQHFLELVLCVILIGITYVIWMRPKLVLRDEVIEVVNPLRTELIPYHEVLDLETKWALTIVHSQGKTTVWVAPVSGKRRWIADKKFGWYGGGIPLSESRKGGPETMSESLISLSGQAAYLIRERIKRLH
jgi:hypothetical protein